jgi:hypothetical protein
MLENSGTFIKQSFIFPYNEINEIRTFVLRTYPPESAHGAEGIHQNV